MSSETALIIHFIYFFIGAQIAQAFSSVYSTQWIFLWNMSTARWHWSFMPPVSLKKKIAMILTTQYVYWSVLWNQYFLNNRVCLLRDYRLTVAQQKFDVLETNISPRSKPSRANVLVLRIVRPIVPRKKTLSLHAHH